MVSEYRRSQNQMKELQAKLDGKRESQRSHDEKVGQMKNNWLTPLNNIIDKINTKFSDYFRQMKCAGEVTLSVPSNPVSSD